MNTSYNCTSVKEFHAMCKCIRRQLFADVDGIYNIGGSQYYEHPLFIVMCDVVFRIYYSQSELSLTVYDRAYFRQHCNEGVFRDAEDPQNFDYISPDVRCQNVRIIDMHAVKGCGTEQNLRGFDIVFSDGKRLCIRESELVPYTMDSWLTA